LLLGFLIMTAGLYFGLFTTGAGEGLGFLALMASPFVMVADRD
jgi:predicted RND superfamily exporter protein